MWSAFALTMVLLTTPSAGQDQAPLFQRAVSAEAAGDLPEAERLYREVLGKDPRRVDARANLGMVLLKTGRPEPAAEALGLAVQARPDLVQVRYFYGLALFQTGRADAARRELGVVLTAEPRRMDALHLLALSLLKLGELKDGIDALEQVVSAQPGNRRAAYTLASAYLQDGDGTKCEQLLNGPLATDRSAEVRMIRGTLLERRGEYSKAVEELEAAFADNPSVPTLQTRLGFARLGIGDFDRAAEDFRRAAAADAGDYSARSALGYLALRDRKYDEAGRWLAEADKLRPNQTGVSYMMAQVNLARGDYAKAAQRLERVTAEQPGYRPAHVLLARAYARLGRAGDVRKEQAIIRTLQGREQEKHLEENQSYGGGAHLPVESPRVTAVP